MKQNIFIIILSSFIVSCATRTTPAPIVHATDIPDYLQTKPKKLIKTEEDTPTLGSINNSSYANTQSQSTTKPLSSNNNLDQSTQPNNNSGSLALKSKDWISPTKGEVVDKFTPANKGVDYRGIVGQSINAVNDGKVVYSGNGLKGYGNLIIIKHDKVYLSAYAHNQSNLVKDGDFVKRGQKIATMGDINNKAILHLEIRQNGKPIDPLSLIN